MNRSSLLVPSVPIGNPHDGQYWWSLGLVIPHCGQGRAGCSLVIGMVWGEGKASGNETAP